MLARRDVDDCCVCGARSRHGAEKRVVEKGRVVRMLVFVVKDVWEVDWAGLCVFVVSISCVVFLVGTRLVVDQVSCVPGHWAV